MSLRLATCDGKPVPARNFWCAGGVIRASDGSEIAREDAPLLVQAWARETVKLAEWGALDTARRFGLEALRLRQAIKMARQWWQASGPVVCANEVVRP